MAKLLDHEAEFVDRAKARLQAENPDLGSSNFVAFVVWLPDSDEFLNKHQKNNDSTVYKWVRGIPDLARRYSRLKKAQAVASEKDGAVVAILLETDKKYVVSQLE